MSVSSESLPTAEAETRGRRPDVVTRAFHRWTQANDEPAIVDGIRNAWIEIGVGIALIALAAIYVPGARAFFGFNPWPLIWSYLAFIPVSLAITWLHRGKSHLTTAGWVLLIVGSPLVSLMAAAFIAGAQMPGAAVFACLYLVAVGYHGFLYRTTLSEPFIGIGAGLAGLVALWMNPDPAHIAIFSILIPAAVTIAFVVGTHAKQRDRHRQENERLRAAIDAQILAQREQEVRSLSHTLMELLGTNHDLRNAVMSAQLVADGLSEFARHPELLASGALPELSDDLKTSLRRIQELVEKNRHKGREAGIAPETIDVRPVVSEVITDLRRRFPVVRIEEQSTLTDRALVRVPGGAVTLRRILHNVVQNACEGNGQQSASAVTLSLQRDRSGMGWEITVTDNGPGFPSDALDIQPYATTKADGTGLGLYTTEQLIRASHGTFRLGNAPEGGARVTIVLPLAEAH